VWPDFHGVWPTVARGGESESHLLKCVTTWTWLITVYFVVSETHCLCYMVRMRKPFTVQLASQVRMVTKFIRQVRRAMLNTTRHVTCFVCMLSRLAKTRVRVSLLAAQGTRLEREVVTAHDIHQTKCISQLICTSFARRIVACLRHDPLKPKTKTTCEQLADWRNP
jgi:hypothetical protein